MNKKGQLIFNPKMISFGIGGAIIGYLFFQKIDGAIIGGLIGIGLSFIK